MTLPVKISNMKDAERLSHICRAYPDDLYLRSDKLCVDPKSVLGILALLYSGKDHLVIDTGNMTDEGIAHLIPDLSDLIADAKGEMAS